MLRPLRLWVMYLPQLAACYLLGLLGRNVAIGLAAWVGADNALWADLLMPFAGFSRLASFVAMFMVLRRAIPALERLPRTAANGVDLFSNVVVPFFAIYIGWQMLKDDWIAFGATSLYYMGISSAQDKVTQLDPSDIPISDVAWALIIGAFVLQHVLKWFEARTPKWFAAIRLYLQIFLVFLTLSFAASKGATVILEPSKWFSERRLVVWYNAAKEHLVHEYAPIRIGSNIVTAIWHTVWDVAAMPLLWLAIAGLVYGVSAAATWRGAARGVVGERGAAMIDRATPAQERLQQRVQERLAVAPPTLVEKSWAWVKNQFTGFFGKYSTIVNSARPLLHAGLLPLSVYVLAFVGTAWLSVTDSFYRLSIESGYLLRGFAWLMDWHDATFWYGPGGLIFLLADTLVTCLRICLVASVYAYCVEKTEAEERVAAPGPVPVTASVAP